MSNESRVVTDLDFRMPEYRDAKPEDYEFRRDGRLARKDRWESAVRRIVSIVGMNVREFEIDDVLAAVEKLVAKKRAPAELPVSNHLDAGEICPSAPERVWLQIEQLPYKPGGPVWPDKPNLDEVQWCEHRQNATDTMYIRADLAASAVAKGEAAQSGRDSA